MKDMPSDSYPGSSASPVELFMLAQKYHAATLALGLDRPGRKQLSRSPARLCALHAIELYLSAFLRKTGDPPEAVRGYCHDLARRADCAASRGLVLRKRTRAHLKRVTQEREYLVSRYGPEMLANVSQGNRLLATLDEVARKVGRKLRPPACVVHLTPQPCAGVIGATGSAPRPRRKTP